jgi:hypothetical protein
VELYESRRDRPGAEPRLASLTALTSGDADDRALPFAQCVEEHWSEKIDAQNKEGCNVAGRVRVNKVVGNVRLDCRLPPIPGGVC